MPKVTVSDVLEGARLRTLPAAISPVIAGAGAAWFMGSFSAGKSVLAFLVAALLQVGVNLANDYSDGVRGTDEHRVGPKRLTASGMIAPKRVLTMALACFAVAGLCGLGLVAWSGVWWLLVVGIAAVLAAWFYTGGKHPYAYVGLGISELMVFVFFGLLATVGTAYVQSYSAPWWLWVAASGLGFSSIALLMVNNLRDIPTDRQAGKITLAVRMGPTGTRWAYAACIVMAVVSAVCVVAGALSASPVMAAVAGVIVAVLLVAAGLPGALTVLRGATGPALLPPLRNTGLFALLTGFVEAVALVLAH